jgi:light-regulated signal transduction histidine kinase (bacteriophytochrome)
MTPSRRTPTKEHDLRMHLGVILMALQMISRSPTTPLTADQKELIDIMHRAAKSMQILLDKAHEGSKGSAAEKS